MRRSGKWKAALGWMVVGLATPSLAGAQAAPGAPAAEAPRVRVAGGTLSGTRVAGEGAPVVAWLGIPYAAPPVGALRWRPPQPAARWTGVRAADRFGARCTQQPLFADMIFRSPGASEDCLFLNVWAPADARPGRRLPVLFYIHGGGAVAGDGSERRYDGASLARRGAVVVTINYRLGALGFLALPELAAESPAHAAGNYGLLDQAAALDWVRANIAAFGGDPRRITIGGESAGSMSVSVLLTSPLTRAHVAGAIGESGGVFPPTFHPRPLAEAEGDGRAFADAAGAPTLAALRALPAERVLAVQGERRFRADFILDGLFLTEAPADTYRAGRAARVPLLVGSNTQEGAAGAVLGDAAPTLANYRSGLARLFGARADEAFALYPAAGDADVPAAATRLASDRFLGASTAAWRDAHRRTGAPTYAYLFARVRPPALPPLPNAGPPPLGAVHSAEIEYALGNIPTNPLYAWTPADRAISATMEGYFAAFVRSGNPNAPGLPAWPVATAAPGPVPREVIGADTHMEPTDGRDGARAALLDGVPR